MHFRETRPMFNGELFECKEITCMTWLKIETVACLQFEELTAFGVGWCEKRWFSENEIQIQFNHLYRLFLPFYVCLSKRMLHGVHQFPTIHFEFFDRCQLASCLSVRSSQSLHIAYSWLPFHFVKCVLKCGVDHTWWRTLASLIYEHFCGH